MKFKGVTMQRLSSFLSLLILASLLAGCAPRANAQSKEVKAVDSSYAKDLVEFETVSKTCGLSDYRAALSSGRNIHEMVSMNA
jgi:hypothetical protein